MSFLPYSLHFSQLRFFHSRQSIRRRSAQKITRLPTSGRTSHQMVSISSVRRVGTQSSAVATPVKYRNIASLLIVMRGGLLTTSHQLYCQERRRYRSFIQIPAKVIYFVSIFNTSAAPSASYFKYGFIFKSLNGIPIQTKGGKCIRCPVALFCRFCHGRESFKYVCMLHRVEEPSIMLQVKVRILSTGRINALAKERQ